ncbi:hypothetical protein GCM10011491_12440 [Brucella endophytica]|uniref:Uncharacterized protein n=1 Tax=Brucella endophytica TaxID=1963359 RepID=A0A916S6B5_9HYPH|nr:hypothetical protein GCM10011491_12440 [Brucella endophytica]
MHIFATAMSPQPNLGRRSNHQIARTRDAGGTRASTYGAVAGSKRDDAARRESTRAVQSGASQRHAVAGIAQRRIVLDVKGSARDVDAAAESVRAFERQSASTRLDQACGAGKTGGYGGGRRRGGSGGNGGLGAAKRDRWPVMV